MGARTSSGAVRGAVLVALVVAPVVAFFYWFFACPCERTPGGYLLGSESEEQIADWSFANDVPLCQIQISVRFLPHSINLNCMSTTEGDLYLSCSNCDSKRWSNAAVGNGSARLRLHETVYPVTVARVMDPDELDRAWHARLTKLHRIRPAGWFEVPPPPIGTPRPAEGDARHPWWSFRVVSR